MPLYELVCIAQRFNTTKNALPLQALLKDTSAFVHESGGCVRRMDYHGLQGLPQRTRKDGKWHEQGDLWTMWFDVNPRTLANLREKMRTDPRVLRSTLIRKGVTFSQVTAALPRSPSASASRINDTSLASTPSLYSSNSNFPATISYPPPVRTDPTLSQKRAEGKTSRAEEEALQRQRQALEEQDKSIA